MAYPHLNTDWWNYGGLTRDVSLVDVPAQFIDDYDLHLNRDRTAIEGSVHVEDAKAGEEVTVSFPELNRSVSAKVGTGNLAIISLSAAGMDFWTPEHPKLYKVRLHTADDTLEDEMGFRTIEVRGTDILLNGKPFFCAAFPSTEKPQFGVDVPTTIRTLPLCLAGPRNWAAIMCGSLTILMISG